MYGVPVPKAPPHFAGALGGRRLPRQFQRGGPVLRDLELLGLDGLLGLQGEKLVRRLHGLQRAGGRLALAHEVGQRAFVLRQVLRHLRLHPHGGMQAV